MTSPRAAALLACLAGLAGGAHAAAEPPAGDPDWHIPVATPDPSDPADSPRARQMKALGALLDTYRQRAAAGGWTAVPAGPALRPGDRDPRIALLRRRLRETGDHDGEAGADAWSFDAALARAVARFQHRHGLASTQVLDEPTQARLDAPLDGQIMQLRATLERWRWLPADPGPRHVWVNVPAGTLALHDGAAAPLVMRVIAGHPERPTPAFRADLRAIVRHPGWSVPARIAREDLLPQLRADPGFLARHGFHVRRGVGDTAREVDPATIDWRAVDGDRLPWRFWQAPGPDNSLGGYKFVIDNPFDISLHDTPQRGLFSLTTRAFSSGCIRVEEPATLATRLLGTAPPDDGRTRALPLADPVPVWVVYLTAWVDDGGQAHFRRDLYGRDARLAATLH